LGQIAAVLVPVGCGIGNGWGQETSWRWLPGIRAEAVSGIWQGSAMVDPGAQRVVRVLPDVVGIDKEFDYLVPDGIEVGVGDVVRIDLHGRRVGGWVVAVDVEPDPGVALRPLAKRSGHGPAPDLIELAGWAAWRWAGRRAHLLRTASPPGVVRSLRDGRTTVDTAAGRAVSGRGDSIGAETIADGVEGADGAPRDAAGGHGWLEGALAAELAVLRMPPGADRYPLVLAAAADAAGAGQVLVLCPSADEARALGRRLRRDGIATAIVASDGPGAAAAGEWAHAASGSAQAVVGARAAAWAPAPELARVVVLDEHDEGYQQEQAPTWHARDVVIERAARAGARCLLVSPCPSLEALAAVGDGLITVDRGTERAGWPRIEVIDQRDLDPSLGPLFSPSLVELVRSDRRVVCVLNRTGRARLLTCAACRTLARCEVCDAAVSQVESATEPGTEAFGCPRCGAERPVICLHCHGAKFKHLRLGVSRAREELEVLAGRPVVEVTAAADTGDVDLAAAPLLIGTEAVLHRVARADAVAFLDFDQELLSTRYRAAEQAMSLLARAARLVMRGGGPDGRLLVQTRSPDHQVLVAARASDPGRLAESERQLRPVFAMPPAVAMAIVSGEAGPAFMDALGRPSDLRIDGPLDGAWRLRALDHEILCDHLADVARPPGRLRIEVDPLRA
jgi:primosomal protein N' (replication factor Y)